MYVYNIRAWRYKQPGNADDFMLITTHLLQFSGVSGQVCQGVIGNRLMCLLWWLKDSI